MKILIIANLFPPDMGGGATRAYNVAKGLVLYGNEVTIITSFPHYPTGEIPKKYQNSFYQNEKIGSMRIIRTFILPLSSKGVGKRFLLFCSFLFSSIAIFPIVSHYDIVWAANPNLLSYFPAKFYGMLKRKPVVQNIDDLWPEDLYNFQLLPKNSLIIKTIFYLASFIYNNSAAVTPVSPGYSEVLKNKYHLPQRKITEVMAGVDLDLFSSISQQFKTKSDIFRILYSGSFSVAYDFRQILLAARILKNDNIEFILQGAGECLDEIKKEIDEKKILNVKIIEKILRRDEVVKLYIYSDALILPLRKFNYYYYGLSSKLFEYQAAGKPIICCSNGFPGQFIKKTKSGIVIDSGQYNDLAKSIIQLKTNPALSQKLGMNGRNYVENNVSVQKIGFLMKTLFEKILVKKEKNR
jgi:glycosyltransferase involved in cell wall biosynthesis